MKHPPASLLIHPHDVDLFVLDDSEVTVTRLEAVVAVEVVVVSTAAAVVVVHVVVVKVVDVLIDVNDFADRRRLGLHFADPRHRRLFWQLRTLVAVLTRIEARALVSSETVVARTLPIPVPLVDRSENRSDSASALDDDVIKVRRDAPVNFSLGRLRRQIVVAELPLG